MERKFIMYILYKRKNPLLVEANEEIYTISMCPAASRKWLTGNQSTDGVRDEDLACRATNDSTSGFTSWGASSFMKWTVNKVRRLLQTRQSYSFD
jgi:hypothetical protein